MNTTESGIVRQRLPGVISGRVMTALFSGGSATVLATGPFLMNPETAIPALLVSLGGTVGSFFYGVSRAKKNAHRYAQTFYGIESPPVPESKNIARAILGIPFKPERVLVSSTPYVRPARRNLLSVIEPLTVKRVSNEVMLHQAVVETDNYLLYTPQGVYLEQVTKPTALATWDAAYNALIDQYQIPTEKIAERRTAPQERENALDAMINGFSKEITSLKKFLR